MSTIAPVQRTVTVGGGTDHPIALVDWISLFLKTLKTFNAVVDQISTVSITLGPINLSQILIRSSDPSLPESSVDHPLFCFQGLAVALHRTCNLIYRSQIIIDQANRDDSVCELLSKMNDVYRFLTAAELKAIESMRAIVERIALQTVQCSYFVQAYCTNQKFRELIWP